MIKRLFYRYVCKRTSTFVLGIVVTSFMFERTYDYICESIFEWINDGRLWMHIKHRYENPPVFPVVEETGSKQESSNLQHINFTEEISAKKKTD